MPQTVHIGLIGLRSGSGAATSTATLDNVSVRSYPSPWQFGDVGYVGVSGNTQFANGTFTVQAGGVDLWETSDGVHYVFQNMSGDGEIVAEVTGITNPTGSYSAMAAVMMRERLTASSIHASMMVSTDGKAKFRRRTTQGGVTISDGPQTGSTYPPRWLKLTRAGDVFTAAISTDGVTWTQVHTPQRIVMPTELLIGFAFMRNGGTNTATATIRNVTVVP